MAQNFLSQAAPLAGASQRLIRGDRSMLSMSDDNVMMKQILGTHTPDGREVDVRPLLHIVEDILNRATLQVDAILAPTQARKEVEEKVHQASFVAMLEALSFTIDRISSELSYKALSGIDAHATTLEIFSMLSSYPWDAKLVLILAAFALNYGEFWLLAQIYSSNPLAKSMALLRQLPTILENTGLLKPRFDALNNLIKAMMNVTKSVVEFKELPTAYISQEVPALSAAMAHIPTAVYWTARGVVASATQITNISTMGPEYVISTTEAWELSTLAHKLNSINEHLRKQLATCHQHIDEKKNAEAFQMLKHLFETTHIDNMKVLKALIYARDDIQPLIDGTTKRRVHLDVLRRKNVLLFISGLDISQDELSILEQIYNESRVHATRLENQYEVVWMPIMDHSIQWNDPMQKKFEGMQSSMPWYTVYHPSLIEKAVIRFIKEVWHFRNKPILVVLDPQGRVVSPNAIHMMWIWGSNAFPFTSLREDALWREETWRLELLVDGIDPIVLNWIKEGKYIFLYGGDDVEWVRKFTNTARAVAQAARIPLEMLYVGKSCKREQIRRVIATISVEKLSNAWQDLTMIWFFWTRLQSMLYSNIQLGKDEEHDPTMQEIKKLLSYDRSGSWAVLGRGADILVNGHGSTVLPALIEYDLWKDNVPLKGFDISFQEYHSKLHSDNHACSRFEFPVTTGRIPYRMRCPECRRYMEKHSTFLCCHDEIGDPDSLF